MTRAVQSVMPLARAAVIVSPTAANAVPPISRIWSSCPWSRRVIAPRAPDATLTNNLSHASAAMSRLTIVARPARSSSLAIASERSPTEPSSSPIICMPAVHAHEHLGEAEHGATDTSPAFEHSTASELADEDVVAAEANLQGRRSRLSDRANSTLRDQRQVDHADRLGIGDDLGLDASFAQALPTEELVTPSFTPAPPRSGDAEPGRGAPRTDQSTVVP